jgi:hypothetical protein
MSQQPLDTDARELAEDAAEWLSVLETGSSEERTVFVAWLKKSPQHVEAALRMMELDAALSVLLPRKAAHNSEPGRYAVQRYLALNETRTAPRYLLPKELDKYRRAIIQVLLQRRIDRDAAEDLFQDLWLQILEDSGVEILADTDRLSRYLYRAACERVLAVRRCSELPFRRTVRHWNSSSYSRNPTQTSREPSPSAKSSWYRSCGEHATSLEKSFVSGA